MRPGVRYRPWVRRAVRLAGRGWRAARDVVFPPRCAFCEAGLGEVSDEFRLCEDCRCLLAPKRWPCCPRCGASGYFPEGALPAGAEFRCELCEGLSLKFETVIPLGGYEGELRSAVLRMKRPSGEPLSAAIGHVLGRQRRRELLRFEPDLVMPIPMFWARRLRRGTNSPEILAESVASLLRLSPCVGVLVRRRNTLPQADLPPRERFRNVRGAFGLKPGYNFSGLRVLLVDDILTTGATCSEAARTLREAGAAAVAAAVVARAQGAEAS